MRLRHSHVDEREVVNGAIIERLKGLMISGDLWRNMANGNRKGPVLSDVTAQKEYGVTRDFIVKGIQAGKLEYREGAVWGNPYFRVLRSQLEPYIIEELGSKYLVSKKSQTELRTIRSEIAGLRKKLGCA